MAIQTDGFLTPYGITVNFQPWWTLGFRFTKLHLYEELGGKLAYGEMDMIMNGSDDALNAIKDQKDGTITLTSELGQTLTIPIAVTDIVGNDSNYVSINFLCLPSLDFAYTNKTIVWDKPIKKVIEALYPGKVDIRDGCETDIQKDPLYYQNNEPDQNICSRLCFSYKKDCIFSYGLEGLLIKDTLGNKNSHGKNEDSDTNKIDLRVNTVQTTQMDNFAEPATRHFIYKHPINIWEDTESEVSIKDYTEYEPVNFRILEKYRTKFLMHKDYEQLDYNMYYNQDYQNSRYSQYIRIMNRDFPTYRIGDVLIYTNEQKKDADLSWNQKYYLVQSNEIFIAVDSCDYWDEFGERFGWVSKLVCLQENTGGTTVIGSTSDPVIPD